MELREQADLLLSYHDGDDRCGCLREIVTGLLDDELTLSRLVDVLSHCLSEHPAGIEMRRDFGRNMSHWMLSLQRPLQRDDSERYSDQSSGSEQRPLLRSHGRTDVRTYEELPQLRSEHDTKQRAQESPTLMRVECDICHHTNIGTLTENTHWGLDHGHRNDHRSFTHSPWKGRTLTDLFAEDLDEPLRAGE